MNTRKQVVVTLIACLKEQNIFIPPELSHPIGLLLDIANPRYPSDAQLYLNYHRRVNYSEDKAMNIFNNDLNRISRVDSVFLLQSYLTKNKADVCKGCLNNSLFEQLSDVSHVLAKNGAINCLTFWLTTSSLKKFISRYACQNAALEGHYDCLELLIKNKAYKSGKTCEFAAKNGHTECLQLAIDNNFPKGSKCCQSAAENGQYDCLKLLIAKGVPINEESYILAIKNGHYKCLRLLIQYDSIKNMNLCDIAIKHLQIECLELLIKNNYPKGKQSYKFLFEITRNRSKSKPTMINYWAMDLWDMDISTDNTTPRKDDTTTIKDNIKDDTIKVDSEEDNIKDGSIKVDSDENKMDSEEDTTKEDSIKMDSEEERLIKCTTLLITHNFPRINNACYYAVSRGCLKCVELLTDNGFVKSDKCISTAIKKGYLDIFSYLIINGYPKDEDACKYASQHGYYECLEKLINNGFPKSKFARRNAIKYNHWNCVDLLDKHGFPK